MTSRGRLLWMQKSMRHDKEQVSTTLRMLHFLYKLIYCFVHCFGYDHLNPKLPSCSFRRNGVHRYLHIFLQEALHLCPCRWMPASMHGSDSWRFSRGCMWGSVRANPLTLITTGKPKTCWILRVSAKRFNEPALLHFFRRVLMFLQFLQL